MRIKRPKLQKVFRDLLFQPYRMNQLFRLTKLGGGEQDDDWDAACAWIKRN